MPAIITFFVFALFVEPIYSRLSKRINKVLSLIIAAFLSSIIGVFAGVLIFKLITP